MTTEADQSYSMVERQMTSLSIVLRRVDPGYSPDRTSGEEIREATVREVAPVEESVTEHVEDDCRYRTRGST